MEKIFEQIKFEIEKQEFKFGKQNHISVNKFVTVEEHWFGIIRPIITEIYDIDNDYERRAEPVKLTATIVNWIDCIDRNNRAISPGISIEKFEDDDLMPFGKYKGDKLKMVPAQYLLDALENNFIDGLLKDYVIENKTLLLQVIDTGYDCINSKSI